MRLLINQQSDVQGVHCWLVIPLLLPTLPEDSRLFEWREDGHRHEPDGSNIVTVTSPDDSYVLTIELDEAVHGHLIRLCELGENGRGDRIAQTVIRDRDTVATAATEMVRSADDLATLNDDPPLDPDTVYDEESVEAADEWDDEDEWEEALEEAYEKADILRSKGTLTTKTIDGREYYYLQWREGEKLKSQYIAPVSPAS